MGGFFGAVSDRDVALDVFFGTDYHSHLGTRRGGMVLFDKKEGFQRQIHNIEIRPFGRSLSGTSRTSAATRGSAASATATLSRCSCAPIWACTPS